MQILSITCDNATNNDKMIDELELLLEDFPGTANRARCFTHILNLVVKSIMKQFDLPQVKKDDISDEVTMELLKLAGDIEEEEAATIRDDEACDDENDADNTEDWVDKRMKMSCEELDELEDAVRSVRFLLTKASHLIINIT